MSSIRTRLAHMIANQLIIPYRQFLTSLRSLCFVGDHILTSPISLIFVAWIRGRPGEFADERASRVAATHIIIFSGNI